MSGKLCEDLQNIIRRLNNEIHEINHRLNQHNYILQQRGLNFHATVIQDLKTLYKSNERLAKFVTEAETELGQLRALAETTALINSSRETNAVLNQVIDTVIKLTGAERGYLMLKNRQSGELEFMVARGMNKEQLEEKGEFIISKTIIKEVAATGEAQLTDNATQDTRYRDVKSIVGWSLRSILAAPMKARDEVIGVVYCDNRIVSGLFRHAELETLKAFANQAAIAIENARLFEAASEQLAQITEMRDFMDNIFTSIASGVITINKEDEIIISNAAAKAILINELQGARLHEILPEESEEFYRTIRQVYKEGGKRSLTLEPVLEGLGRRYWNVIASPLRNGGGSNQGVVIVLDDQTTRKEREAQFAEIKRYLPPRLLENLRNVHDLDVDGQERMISVLFADVRGFTSFSEQLAPEDVMKIINQYLGIAGDVLDKYDGIVDQYQGDAVIGLFNTQLNPQAEHPLRALQTAITIMRETANLNQKLPHEHRLSFGIGIHTALSIVGNIGGKTRKEFTALGEAPVISKRLQERAMAGEIIISPQTYEPVKAHYRCEKLALPESLEHIAEIYRVVERR